MIIKDFFNEKKIITYTVLISYIVMNMTHAWASDEYTDVNKSHKRMSTLPITDFYYRLDETDPNLHNQSTEYSSNFSKSGEDTERTDHSTLNPSLLATESHTLSTDTFDSEFAAHATDTIVFKLTEPSIYIAQNGEEIKRTDNSSLHTFYDTEKADPKKTSTAAGNQIVPETDISDKIIFSLKLLTSFAVSTCASVPLANLAYKLGELYNNTELAYGLYFAGLLANAMLYYRNQMSLTTKDFTVNPEYKTLKKLSVYSIETAKYVVTFVASAGLAWIGYTQYIDQNPAVAYIVSICGLISQLLLYSKSASNLANDLHNKLNIAKLPTEQRNTVKALQAASDAISILSTDKINEFDEAESIEKMVDQLSPNTNHRFYTKEMIGLIAGFGLSGILGGMYLFEVGKPIYTSLFSTLFPQLSTTRIIQLALTGSSMLALGATPLQVYSTYNVFKMYTEKTHTFLDALFTHTHKQQAVINNDHPHRFKSALYEKIKLYAQEAVIIFFSSGIAATRVGLCVAYVTNKKLLPILTVGVAFSFFSIYYWTMSNLIESLTSAGKKRINMKGKLANMIQIILNKNLHT